SITIGSSVYSVTSIGAWAFSYCDSLAIIEIPVSVTSIGDYAFEYCTFLSSVVFEEGSKLKSIGDYAFEYCSSLKSVTMNGVTPPILGSNAFSNTHSDMKIYVPSGSEDTYKNANEWSFYENKITAKS
ncbi:MAG: leucine-rich repeat domain-containing protein, partial [Clostridiales bacterium]|nr:leucine-rich repeat domain-containing protein [Clostridiales bacterium]